MATIFGASGPTIQDVSHLEYICGKNAVSRSAVIVTEYRGKGSREVDKYLEAGHKVFFNLNYQSVRKTGEGDKIPNPFPKDLDKYRKDLIPIFEYYKDNKYLENIYWVCENEPTTKAFHSGPMADYIAMLRVFVEVGKKYGAKCTDGAVHVDRVLAAKLPKEGDQPAPKEAAIVNIDAGDIKEWIDNFLENWDYDTPDPIRIPGTDILLTSYSSIEEYRGNATEVAQLLAGYKTIPDLYAVSLHTANIGGDYDSTKIPRAVQKIKDLTGHNAVSNEWHVENSNNYELITKMAKGWSDAGVELSVYLSGSGGADVDLNNGMNLTGFGNAYRNYIAVWKAGQS